MTRKIIVGAACVAVWLVSLKAYLGYRAFYRYQGLRSQAADSVEKKFPVLEKQLTSAVRISKNPRFYSELGRLYHERALFENEFGSAEKRDAYLDLAAGAFAAGLERNPADAFSLYELGNVYLLYNYPLFTYLDKGKLCYRKALEIWPANEVLIENILYFFLRQWDLLDGAEKGFVYAQLERERRFPERIFRPLRDRWRTRSGDTEKLKEILSRNQTVWQVAGKYFR